MLHGDSRMVEDTSSATNLFMFHSAISCRQGHFEYHYFYPASTILRLRSSRITPFLHPFQGTTLMRNLNSWVDPVCPSLMKFQFDQVCVLPSQMDLITPNPGSSTVALDISPAPILALTPSPKELENHCCSTLKQTKVSFFYPQVVCPRLWAGRC